MLSPAVPGIVQLLGVSWASGLPVQPAKGTDNKNKMLLKNYPLINYEEIDKRYSNLAGSTCYLSCGGAINYSQARCIIIITHSILKRSSTGTTMSAI